MYIAILGIIFYALAFALLVWIAWKICVRIWHVLRWIARCVWWLAEPMAIRFAARIVGEPLWLQRWRATRAVAAPARPPNQQARQSYETKLLLLEAAGLDEIELRAGKARAKQMYLKELDGLMQ